MKKRMYKNIIGYKTYNLNLFYARSSYKKRKIFNYNNRGFRRNYHLVNSSNYIDFVVLQTT